MHYDPVINASQGSLRQDVANPDRKQLQKELAELKRALKTCKQDLGSLSISTNKDGSLRKSGKREQLLQNREDLKIKIAAKSLQVKACPERAVITEEDDDFKKQDTEGRNLWNLAQTMVWNSRKKLIAEFEQFLPNPRDLIPVLEAITASRGWIKSTDQKRIVCLEPLETPRFKMAQEKLYQALTDKKTRLNNCGKRLVFKVNTNPLDVQKL